MVECTLRELRTASGFRQVDLAPVAQSLASDLESRSELLGCHASTVATYVRQLGWRLELVVALRPSGASPARAITRGKSPLGSTLGALRQAAQLSQTELAERAGLSQSKVSALERSSGLEDVGTLGALERYVRGLDGELRVFVRKGARRRVILALRRSIPTRAATLRRAATRPVRQGVDVDNLLAGVARRCALRPGGAGRAERERARLVGRVVTLLPMLDADGLERLRRSSGARRRTSAGARTRQRDPLDTVLAEVAAGIAALPPSAGRHENERTARIAATVDELHSVGSEGLLDLARRVESETRDVVTRSERAARRDVDRVLAQVEPSELGDGFLHVMRRVREQDSYLEVAPRALGRAAPRIGAVPFVTPFARETDLVRSAVLAAQEAIDMHRGMFLALRRFLEGAPERATLVSEASAIARSRSIEVRGAKARSVLRSVALRASAGDTVASAYVAGSRFFRVRSSRLGSASISARPVEVQRLWCRKLARVLATRVLLDLRCNHAHLAIGPPPAGGSLLARARGGVEAYLGAALAEDSNATLDPKAVVVAVLVCGWGLDKPRVRRAAKWVNEARTSHG